MQWMYHKDGEMKPEGWTKSKLCKTTEEAAALGADWADSPDAWAAKPAKEAKAKTESAKV